MAEPDDEPAAPPSDPPSGSPLPPLLEEPPAEAPCRRCRRPLKPGADFCAHCGTPRLAGVARPATFRDRRRVFDRAWGDVLAAVGLYALLLASSAATLIAVRLTGETFGA